MQPMFTFNPTRKIVYVNAAGLKLLPETEYALLVISATEKRLNIYPCDATTRDAVRLRFGGLSKNKSRYIRCLNNFSDKLMSLMAWSSNNRYRIRGEIALSDNNIILTFDLATAEVVTYAA